MKKLYKRNQVENKTVEAYATTTYASCTCSCICPGGTLNSILGNGGLSKSLNKYS